MTDRSQLADALALVLADEPLGLSCDALARCLHRRKADVLAAVSQDRRFVRSGTTRGSRWHLVAGTNGNEWERLSERAGVLTRLDAIEARLDALERRNGRRTPA